ncbi:unnamed protein product [Acanthoscelides obtectus]|uniref:Uncharacterized protein n=1 Tax=Acanthoscelides obtectus TaxID=200917 RepID=A0A9P0L2T0_ACAOB|nr:unnamed protein product [Acanthoscelides obtectus]CAK1662231.1 hypothetical protein AOBTE_LOCUS23046 [Acanthoscelides obtectus]
MTTITFTPCIRTILNKNMSRKKNTKDFKAKPFCNTITSISVAAISSLKFCITEVANCWISIYMKGETTNFATIAISLKSLKRFLKLSFKLETIST